MRTIGIYGPINPELKYDTHDHGFTVMDDGQVIYQMELERLTGKKHDGEIQEQLPDLISRFQTDDTQIVVANSFVGNEIQPLLKCSSTIQQVSTSLTSHRNYLEISHELAHIGTCLPFYGDFKPNSLLVHIDGGASDSCASAWFYDGVTITKLYSGWHPTIKQAVNNFNANPLSFELLDMEPSEHLSLPGKLMGFSKHHTHTQSEYDNLLSNTWEAPASPIPQEQKMSIASAMQKYLEDEVLKFISKYQTLCKANHLYYSGGAALNIHANTLIENTLNFDSVNIPPAPSDCGLSLGAAAFLQWQNKIQIQPHSAFINSDLKSEVKVDWKGLKIVTSIEEVAHLISTDEVVACYFHKGEIGPRALGHRSLLARADSVSVRKKLSEDMKQREWYRPVAPMMKQENASEFLEDYKIGSKLSQYMLGAWKVRAKHRGLFEGVVHTDGTVRAQTITSDVEETKHIYDLLTQLEKHKIYGLINTSFNSRGKPIVNSVQDAVDQAVSMGVKYFWSDSQIN